MQEKRIFTFWEPKKNMPGYIRLCLKTWQKFLPDYEVIVCDYDNLKNYLSRKEIHQFLCKKFPLQQQSDALRTILLKKYGGIWLDADTILTSASFFLKLKNPACTMIGKGEAIHLAFIYAQKGSLFIKKWSESVCKKVSEFRQFQYLLFFKKLFKEKRQRLKNWDYLGNSIINPLRHSVPRNEFLMIDKDEIRAFPENFYCPKGQKEISPREKYEDFYFSKHQTSLNKILEETKGIILLHNSWTPEKYKKMTQEEFLKQDILLAQLLKKILEVKE